MIRAMMAEVEFVGFTTQRQSQQLVTEADTEHGFFPEYARDGSVSVRQRGRVRRAIRQENSIRIVRQNLCRGRRRGYHLDPEPGRNQAAQNVQFDSVVERYDEGRISHLFST